MEVNCAKPAFATESFHLNRCLQLLPSFSARQVLTHNGTRGWRFGNATGVAQINIAGNSESSSLLAMCDHHVAACPSSAFVASETVDVVTLDSLQTAICGPDDRTWLKIDVQGYEAEVLAGAQRTLSQVRRLRWSYHL